MQPPEATLSAPRTKDDRYREIVATLARHGFGILEDHFVADDDATPGPTRDGKGETAE